MTREGVTPCVVCAVDPGYEQSAYVLFDGSRVQAHDLLDNLTMLAYLATTGVGGDHVVCEHIEGMGMPVGREVFETIFWTGRFFEAAVNGLSGRGVYRSVHRLSRRAVKLHLCGSARAKDANIRAALLDRFGGKTTAIGSKATPGPLYGIKTHEWAALALAVTWSDTHAKG